MAQPGPTFPRHVDTVDLCLRQLKQRKQMAFGRFYAVRNAVTKKALLLRVAGCNSSSHDGGESMDLTLLSFCRQRFFFCSLNYSHTKSES